MPAEFSVLQTIGRTVASWLTWLVLGAGVGLTGGLVYGFLYGLLWGLTHDGLGRVLFFALHFGGAGAIAGAITAGTARLMR
jgi:hypothetical protein